MAGTPAGTTPAARAVAGRARRRGRGQRPPGLVRRRLTVSVRISVARATDVRTRNGGQRVRAAMASATASVRRALATWRCSIILPSTVIDAAALGLGLRVGGDHPAGVARPRRPTATTPSFAGSTWLGVDQRLAVEAHLDALAALGGEALGVAHVVVDAVEDRPCRPPGPPARRSPGSASEVGPAGDQRGADLLGEVVGAHHQHARRAGGRRSRGRRRSPSASRPSPRSTCRRRRRRRGAAATVVELGRRRRPSGSRRPTAAAAPAAARSSAPHGVASPLQRIVSSRPPYSPDVDRGDGLRRGPPAWRRARRRPRGRR